MQKIYHILSLLLCVGMMLAVSLRRDGRLWGHEIRSSKSVVTPTHRTLDDGTQVINTQVIGKDIIGYAGTVPLEIYFRSDTIRSVQALPNHETPRFMHRAQPLLSRWNGLTLREAAVLEVDGITGATYTSRAIKENMRAGIQFARSSIPTSTWHGIDLSAKALIGLLVALAAAILPLLIKNKVYRFIQLLLNVGVLGCWCGACLSYTALISYLSNGIHITMLLPIVLLVTAFIYPLFGKKHYYCTQVCPFGSLQELAGRCVRYKLPLTAGWVKGLSIAREVLWAVLMLCLWTGAWFDWIEYEPFSAFVFSSASWVVFVIAGLFILLSTVIHRPYCRFVCPTGTLLKFSEGNWKA